MLFRFVVLFAMVVNFSFAADATLKISKKIGKKPTIVVEDASFFGTSDGLHQKVAKLIIGDLVVSSNFKVDENIQDSEFDAKVDFGKYNAQDLVLRFRLHGDDENNLRSDVKLFDVKSAEVVFEKKYKISAKERYAFLAHKMVIDVNNFLELPPIDWMKKFVIFAKYTEAGKSDIVVSDYTLTFQKRVITGGLNIFPKWASKEQKAFYYTSYERLPTLYRVDLYTGKRTKITTSSGMLVCSDVLLDGSKLLLTMAPNLQADIYEYDVKTKKTKRVTYYKGIDVNGQFIDGGKRVVFASDRLGNPNIFSKTIGRKGVQRLVYHGKNNSSCTAYENYIAYSSRETDNAFGRNTFNIYLISTKSDYIRRLTASGQNQFPKFSSDGESILFIKHFKGQSALGIIRINYNKSYYFPLSVGKIQSIDW